MASTYKSSVLRTRAADHDQCRHLGRARGQKAIVIGQGGERLKEIGRLARIELNDLWQRSVHLELWVKVKENWRTARWRCASSGTTPCEEHAARVADAGLRVAPVCLP